MDATNATNATVAGIQYRLKLANTYIAEHQKKITEMEERIQNAINSIFDRPPSDDIDMYKMIIKSAKDVLIEEKRQLEMAEQSRAAAEQQQLDYEKKMATVTVIDVQPEPIQVLPSVTGTEEQKTDSPISTPANELVSIQSTLESSS